MRGLRRRAFRRAVWTVAVAGILLSQAASVSASQADPTPPSTQPTDAELGQDKLDAAAESIKSISAADDAYYEAGIDLDKQTVVVFRKGGDTGLSQSVKALYTEKALGATVEFRNALFTTSEMFAIQDTIVAANEKLEAEGIVLSTIGSSPPGGPIVVKYSPKGAPADLDVFNRLGITRAWPRAALDGGVQFETGDVAPFDRISDTSPLYGGARIHAPSIVVGGQRVWETCTTGYGVRSTTAGVISAFITTAWHCYNPANPVMYNQWTSSGNFAIGNVSSVEATYDTAYVKIGSSRTSAPRIFNGPPVNNTQSMPVVSSGPISFGDEYCASGANSYNTCEGIITQTNVLTPITNAYTGEKRFLRLDRLSEKHGAFMGAEGDSGGPVYSFANSTSVVARGMIAAGNLDSAALRQCPSYITDVEPEEGHPTACTTDLYISSASSAAAAHDVTYVW